MHPFELNNDSCKELGEGTFHASSSSLTPAETIMTRANNHHISLFLSSLLLHINHYKGTITYILLTFNNSNLSITEDVV